jgi:hypothetical protein
MRLRAYWIFAFVVLSVALFDPIATAQDKLASEESRITGTVVSTTSNTIVLKTSDNTYHLFIFDRYTIRPKPIALGSTVRVTSTPSGEPGVRAASEVAIVEPPAPAKPAPAPGTPAATTESDTIPVSIRKLEHDMERATRRYGIGVRGGASLDPETILLGAHAKFGPFFSSNLYFRPNVDFGFGEVTKLFAVNLEAAYRLPLTPPQGRWSAYLGVGPSFIFQHQNFERTGGIDFGQFDFVAGLNVLGGVEFRSGVFFEVKSTVYASPHLRMLVGYTF